MLRSVCLAAAALLSYSGTVVHAACEGRNTIRIPADFNGDGPSLQDQLVIRTYGGVIVAGSAAQVQQSAFDKNCIMIMTDPIGPSYAEYPDRIGALDKNVMVAEFRKNGSDHRSDILSINTSDGTNHLYVSQGGAVEPTFNLETYSKAIFNRYDEAGQDASLKVADLVGNDGISEVFAWWPYRGQTKLVSFADSRGVVQYDTKIPPQAINGTTQVVLGDLNQDGRADLSFYVGAEIRDFCSNGDGSFSKCGRRVR